jgi:hypothetical protein
MAPNKAEHRAEKAACGEEADAGVSPVITTSPKLLVDPVLASSM